MAISKDRIQELIASLEGNNLVDAAQLEKVVKLWQQQQLPDQAAYEQLLRVRDRLHPEVDQLDFKDEWANLTDVLIASEYAIKKSTRTQLYIGLWGVPVFVVGMLVLIKLHWFDAMITVETMAFIGVLLSIVLAYTFFILRKHQQASLAIERLTEKRLALLYLKIAVSMGKEKIDADSLIKAGTAMFLGHHAPATLPLSPDDLAAAKKVQA
jgi:hypothetical protein